MMLSTVLLIINIIVFVVTKEPWIDWWINIVAYPLEILIYFIFFWIFVETA